MPSLQPLLRRAWGGCLLLMWVGWFLAPVARGQEVPAMPYRLPPEPIAAMVEAPPTPTIRVAPDGAWMLLQELPGAPPVVELAQPELRLGGLRIHPRLNDLSRRTYISGISLIRLSDGTPRAVTGLPQPLKLRQASWSPDSRHIALVLASERGLELWMLNSASGRAKRLIDEPLNGAWSRPPCRWMPDSRHLLCHTLPAERGPEPATSLVPAGPVVQETGGRKAPARTWQDLLRGPHDERLFEYYLTSQLVRVSLDGKVRPLGAPGLLTRAEPAPGGDYVLVEHLHRPFSYLVPAWRFPRRVEIWSRDGELVKTLADLPLQEEVPVSFDAVPEGPRDFDWRADAPASISWIEAQDGGDPRREAKVRDRVFLLAEPFSDPPTVLASLELRFDRILWGNESLALITERWWKTRRTRTFVLKPGAPEVAPRLLFDRSSEDRYSDPGQPIQRWTSAGTRVLEIGGRGQTIYLVGDGASSEGDRPFIDQLNLANRRFSRLWQSQAPWYERPLEVLDWQKRQVLLTRESISEPPNYFLRELRKSSSLQLTRFPHPYPALAGLSRELIRYERADGVKLTGTLYLPPGFKPGDPPLPLLMWVYPQEFKSAESAGQVPDSPYRFMRIYPGSPLFLLARGYAVLEDPSLPIVGEGQSEPNDTYVEQLVAGAKAAVDEVVRRGVADRDRIAIGGHSYGAFTTANLLIHSDLFRAGIARSGAYNRTLTPFGFQAEERTLWEGLETYIRVSPLLHAHRLDEPLLLIHGTDDSNAGTWSLQSERLYQALCGLGGTARLVMLPLEGHGYRAKESVLHMLWEMDRWLERYVRDAPPRSAPQAGASSEAVPAQLPEAAPGGEDPDVTPR